MSLHDWGVVAPESLLVWLMTALLPYHSQALVLEIP
jgi:hypothetical protein